MALTRTGSWSAGYQGSWTPSAWAHAKPLKIKSNNPANVALIRPVK